MKFRAHETFYIRKGWLNKGLKNVKKEPRVFSDKEFVQTDILGIGANMVKSLRYWMQAVGLTVEERVNSQKPQRFTRFGEIVWENDKYFEEPGTLYFLHYKLASNKELATSWYWLFNEYNVREFSKDDFVNGLDGYIRFNEKEQEVAMSSLEADFSCVINTYLSKRRGLKEAINPEDIIESPLSELGLIEHDECKNIYYKKSIKQGQVSPLIFLAVILEHYKLTAKNKFKEIKIADLLEKKSNVGKIFNMDLMTLNHYIDELSQCGYLKAIRTAGIDVIQITTDMKWDEALEKYYNEINL
ncbi:DUF4007 family protein [Herbivorax sp. ANBcel31]|uniref:DUF4007 family protein n=1 Tax=Herbivorax sp. ANBcel31 TaxID=3069754 RepID=UPI0027B36F25|nr:DUF4007 family protein [Herbivorax sp. ANBcel31]MDQ2087930.1 DUF4007 family protein [Herbivorax sp. ANBcel31]